MSKISDSRAHAPYTSRHWRVLGLVVRLSSGPASSVCCMSHLPAVDSVCRPWLGLSPPGLWMASLLSPVRFVRPSNRLARYLRTSARILPGGASAFRSLACGVRARNDALLTAPTALGPCSLSVLRLSPYLGELLNSSCLGAPPRNICRGGYDLSCAFCRPYCETYGSYSS